MTSAPVTVVVVLYRTETLDLSWVPDRARVVLVHNDDTPCAITPDRPVEHLHPGTNLGFGAGVNLAAQGVDEGRLVLVNPDTELRPEHGEVLSGGDDDQIVAIPLLDGHGLPTSIVNLYPTPVAHLATGLRLGRYLARGSKARSLASRAAGGYAAANARSLSVEAGAWPLSTYWVSGGVVSFPAVRFAEVGGFSPDLFMYFEDVDLCARMAEQHPDMRIVIPEVVPGVHDVGGSGRAQPVVTAHHHASSAVTFARGRDGATWSAVAGAIDLRRRRLAQRLPARGAPAPAGRVAAIVSLGRERGMGERRRVESWAAIASTAGLTPVEVPLLRDHRAGPQPRRWPSVLPVLAGRSVLETLTWSARSAEDRLAALAPEVVVLVTGRAYAPNLAGVAPVTILDLVDRLDRSYTSRAAEATGLRSRLAWRAVAWSAGRFTATLGRTTDVVTVLAGYEDARELGVNWVPNTVDAAPTRSAQPDHDLLFFGNLSYPPNIAAVGALDRMWPDLEARRPGTTALIAGAHPSPQVREIVARRGWTLVAHFDDVTELCARGRVAVVPLEHATGIQNKVLEAAACGLPQVVTPEAAAGFAPDAPLHPVPVGRRFVESVVRLLDQPEVAEAQGLAAASYMTETFSAEAWAGWLGALVRDGSRSTAPDYVHR